MIRQMSELFNMLLAIPSGTPVLMNINGKSFDIFVDERGSDKIIFTQGYGEPFSYSAAALISELRLHRPHMTMLVSYGSTSFEIESMTYDGDTLHLNVKVN